MILLVVDVQKLIVDEGIYQEEETLNNIQTLLEHARNHNVPVHFVRHDDGAETELTPGKAGFEIHERVNPLEHERIWNKKVNSAFKETGLLEHLHEIHEKDVMIVGLQTDFCIDASVKCGFEHGLNLWIPEGTNSTVDNEFMTAQQTYAYYNHWMWPNRYATCISMERACEFIDKSGCNTLN